jgi:hypothetical protein
MKKNLKTKKAKNKNISLLGTEYNCQSCSNIFVILNPSMNDVCPYCKSTNIV